MAKYFSGLTFKIGAIIIVVEIVTLFIMGTYYIKSFHNAIDVRLETRSQLPAELIVRGPLAPDSLHNRKLLSTVLGQELMDALVIDRNHTIISSLNPMDTGKNVKDLKRLDPAWFNFESQKTSELLTKESKETDI